LRKTGPKRKIDRPIFLPERISQRCLLRSEFPTRLGRGLSTGERQRLALHVLAEYPPADIELSKIGDLLNCDLAILPKKS
jgi:hypothetical protein